MFLAVPGVVSLRGSSVHANLMGDYALAPAFHEGRPCYKSDDGKHYLYYDESGNWVVGETVGAVGDLNVPSTAESPAALVGAGWKANDGSNWVADAGMGITVGKT